MYLKSRLVLPLILLACLLAACRQAGVASTPLAAAASRPTATDRAAVPSVATGPATADRPADTPTAPPSPEPTQTNAPSVEWVETIAAVELSLAPDDVVLYPVPAIYAGDQVTFQVLPAVPAALRPEDIGLHIYVDGVLLVEGALLYRNLAGQSVGLFEWVWDTTGLSGLHELRVILDPADEIQVGDAEVADNEVVLEVLVRDGEERPVAEEDARWLSRATERAIIHVVSGTAAHRDLDFIAGIVDAAIQQASLRLGEAPAEKLELYLIERVIGQGGYAGGVMVVSYLDRDYAGDGFYEVLVHEAVHLIDRQIARNRIAFLGEGVAVWATGGHYKQEDVATRSAALLQTDLYIPLADLMNEFYPVQHEVGYLIAAGFTDYLVEEYGWEQFKRFYSDFAMESGENEAEAMSRSLQAHFGRSLDELEANWLAELASRPVAQSDIDDLLTTIRFYNVMRQYQINHDRTAYYLEAWLPFPGDAIERGVTADFMRHPQTDLNIALETMLAAVDRDLRSRDYEGAAILLDSIEQVLQSGAFADPLSRAYLALVQQADLNGYEAQQIDLHGTMATVWVTPLDSTDLLQLRFDLNEGMWVLTT